jgi:hypothetical protein
LFFIGIGFRDETVPKLLPDELKDPGGGMWDKFKTGVQNFFK